MSSMSASVATLWPQPSVMCSKCLGCVGTGQVTDGGGGGKLWLSSSTMRLHEGNVQVVEDWQNCQLLTDT